MYCMLTTCCDGAGGKAAGNQGGEGSSNACNGLRGGANDWLESHSDVDRGGFSIYAYGVGQPAARSATRRDRCGLPSLQLLERATLRQRAA